MTTTNVPLDDFKADELQLENAAVTLEDVLPKHNKPWYKVPSLLKLNLLLLIPIMSSTIVGYDGSMLNGLQSLEDWQTFFNHPTGAYLGTISAAPTFGQCFSALFAGYLPDMMGRRPPILIGALTIIVGSILQAAAQNYAMFFIARFIIGVGSGVAVTPSPSLLSELAYPAHRHVMTTAYNVMWYSGSTIAAWVTYGTFHMKTGGNWSWRIPSILQCFFPCIQVLFIYFLPESPRYLVYKDRVPEARAVLAKYHADGDDSARIVDFELAEILQAITAEKEMKASSFKAFFLPENRLRLFIVIAVPFMQQMSGNGLVSYYLSLVLNSIGITTSSEQLVINGALNIYNFGLALIITAVVNRFRRRSLFIASTSGMLFVFTIWTVLSAINQQRNFEQKSLGQGVLTMIFFFFFAYNIGLLGLPYLYMTEVLPFHLRSKGMAITQMVNGLTSVYNGFVNSIAMDAISWKYYIVYCCILALEFCVVFFFFPETKGDTLEESAQRFDNARQKGKLEADPDTALEMNTV
ncbi:general substrate transporter [Dipodascopsis tothii]|uniref:general substrate transporter n=1 Tax=Dipodascopsis tothii TaxID=44089 RepID=UPI0034CFF676